MRVQFCLGTPYNPSNGVKIFLSNLFNLSGRRLTDCGDNIMSEENPSLARFRFQRMLEELEKKEGRGTELITEATLAIKMEATVPDIVATLHAHPSLSEAMHEAALDVTGETIHYPSKNR